MSQRGDHTLDHLCSLIDRVVVAGSNRVLVPVYSREHALAELLLALDGHDQHMARGGNREDVGDGVDEEERGVDGLEIAQSGREIDQLALGMTHCSDPYRVLLDGVAEELDLLEVVEEDVHEGVQLEQRGPVDVAPTAHMNARDDLVSRGQAQAGELHVHVLVVHGKAGVRDVVRLAELHQVNGVIVLHIRRFIDMDLHQTVVLVVGDDWVVEVGVVGVFVGEVLLLAVGVVQHQVAVYAAAHQKDHRQRGSAETRADGNGGIKRVFFVLADLFVASTLAVGDGFDEGLCVGVEVAAAEKTLLLL